jgi:replicative DNA helicase
LGLRLLSSEAEIEATKIRSGFLSSGEGRKLTMTAGELADAPLFIADMPNMKMLDLRSQARRLRRQEKVQIIFIDYLGLITAENAVSPVYEQMADISRSLKSLARELKIPIVALSQLSREAEENEPSLAKIRGSGAIEQDADVVLFLHRKSKLTQEEKENGIETKLILAKQRNGPIDDIKVKFWPKYTKFVPIMNGPEAHG